MDWWLEVLYRPEFGEEITVKTNAVATNKVSFHCYRNFELYDSKNELFARATSKWVFYNFKLNKITKLNLEELNKFKPEGNPDESEEKLKKLKEPETFESKYTYKVKRTDIDINMHMNNLNYLKLAYETLPNNIYLGKEHNYLRIMYKNQIKIDDEVKSIYSRIENEDYITIKSKDEKIIHAIIKLW